MACKEIPLFAQTLCISIEGLQVVFHHDYLHPLYNIATASGVAKTNSEWLLLLVVASVPYGGLSTQYLSARLYSFQVSRDNCYGVPIAA